MLVDVIAGLGVTVVGVMAYQSRKRHTIYKLQL
jgi:hypothetical protein